MFNIEIDELFRLQNEVALNVVSVVCMENTSDNQMVPLLSRLTS